MSADVAAEEQNEVDTMLLMGGRDRRPPSRLGASSPFELGEPVVFRKRPPKRVHTGLFSVDTSDFLGLSNLGQSGLAIGELDPDRRGEVDQGSLSKLRRVGDVKKDPDVKSEEGDTDVGYCEDDLAAEDGVRGATRHKKGSIPRQSSAIVMNNRMMQHDIGRTSYASELEYLRSLQMSRIPDDDAAGVPRYEEVITCVSPCALHDVICHTHHTHQNPAQAYHYVAPPITCTTYFSFMFSFSIRNACEYGLHVPHCLVSSPMQ